MKNQLLQFTSTLLIAAAMISVGTADAVAQNTVPALSKYSVSAGSSGWEDKSDQLPGISSGKSIGLMLGAAVTVGVVSLAVRSNRKKREQKAREERLQQQSGQNASILLGPEGDDDRLRSSAPPVNLVFGLPGMAGKDSQLTLGFSLSF